MGTHNRITKEKFAEVKGKVKEPRDDAKIAKDFGIGETTVRNIRLSKDYQAYCERVFRFHGNPGRRQPKIITYKPDKEAWRRFELLDDEDVEQATLYYWATFGVLALVGIVLLIVAVVAILYLCGGAK